MRNRRLAIVGLVLTTGHGFLKTTYSDFGTPGSVTARPASDLRELPSQRKGVIGGN
jgi:hypothetical protein